MLALLSFLALIAYICIKKSNKLLIPSIIIPSIFASGLLGAFLHYPDFNLSLAPALYLILMISSLVFPLILAPKKIFLATFRISPQALRLIFVFSVLSLFIAILSYGPSVIYAYNQGADVIRAELTDGQAFEKSDNLVRLSGLLSGPQILALFFLSIADTRKLSILTKKLIVPSYMCLTAAYLLPGLASAGRSGLLFVGFYLLILNLFVSSRNHRQRVNLFAIGAVAIPIISVFTLITLSRGMNLELVYDYYFQPIYNFQDFWSIKDNLPRLQFDFYYYGIINPLARLLSIDTLFGYDLRTHADSTSDLMFYIITRSLGIRLDIFATYARELILSFSVEGSIIVLILWFFIAMYLFHSKLLPIQAKASLYVLVTWQATCAYFFIPHAAPFFQLGLLISFVFAAIAFKIFYRGPSIYNKS